jgi:hypothetical protein
MMVFNVYYIAIKAMFFFSLVHAFVKFDALQKHWFFIALLYTAGVVGLSWVWFVAPQPAPDYRAWQIFWLKTAVIAVVYFKLLEKFDEGWLFWTLILLGLLVVYY